VCSGKWKIAYVEWKIRNLFSKYDFNVCLKEQSDVREKCLSELVAVWDSKACYLNGK
jgi:hypothetical protein